jgi:hypothetical protein
MVGALMGDTVLAMKFKKIVQNLDNTTTATTRMAMVSWINLVPN